jgi:NADPH:quinone reductase-like Zn-dependent oxidoreductase
MAQIPQQQTMHAAAIDEFGGDISPHVLPRPEVGPDEILIEVAAAGIGRWDPAEMEGEFASMQMSEATFPYVPGSDGAGIVADVGSQIKNFRKGDRVYAFGFMNPKGGFYAQYVAVKAANASPVPSNLSLEQAGVLAVDGVTALRGLDDVLGVKSGDSVLIFGASGGIGHLAVQLAKRMGARVLAIASGADGVALVEQIGADVVIDGHRDDVGRAARKLAPGGIDAILLTAGGEAAEECMETLGDGGRVAYPNGVQPVPHARPGMRITAYDGTPSPELMKKLNALIEGGDFQVHVAKTFGLDQAAAALQALNSHFVGKLALKPN